MTFVATSALAEHAGAPRDSHGLRKRATFPEKWGPDRIDPPMLVDSQSADGGTAFVEKDGQTHYVRYVLDEWDQKVFVFPEGNKNVFYALYAGGRENYWARLNDDPVARRQARKALEGLLTRSVDEGGFREWLEALGSPRRPGEPGPSLSEAQLKAMKESLVATIRTIPGFENAPGLRVEDVKIGVHPGFGSNPKAAVVVAFGDGYSTAFKVWPSGHHSVSAKSSAVEELAMKHREAVRARELAAVARDREPPRRPNVIAAGVDWFSSWFR
jgi:hypothetical protein